MLLEFVRIKMCISGKWLNLVNVFDSAGGKIVSRFWGRGTEFQLDENDIPASQSPSYQKGLFEKLFHRLLVVLLQHFYAPVHCHLENNT